MIHGEELADGYPLYAPMPVSQMFSSLLCRHPWLLVWPCATNLGLPTARPVAHTLRAVVRSAAVTCSPASVQSISQRGRQRLTAATAQQPPHASGTHLPSHSASNQQPAAPARSLSRAMTAPLATRTHHSTRERLRAPGSPPDAACRPRRHRT